VQIEMLLAGLTSHLQSQKRLFHDLGSVQNKLRESMDANQDLSSVLAILSQKNQLLDQVRQNNSLAAPYVAEWPEARKILGSTPAVLHVKTLLEEVEGLAQTMRRQDEEMIKRFEKLVAPNKVVDQTERSRNMLNAFRALR